MRAHWRRYGWATLVLALLVAACGDDGPSGPGFVEVQVQASEPLGAVVLELSGGLVDGVEEASGGWQALGDVSGGASGVSARYRLVLVREQPATRLTARIRVPDVAGQLPVATLVEATNASDQPVASLASVRAEVRR